VAKETERFFSSEEKNEDEHFANYRQKPGTDVMIKKKILRKIRRIIGIFV
jgi:hypothetical protein